MFEHVLVGIFEGIWW